jgi:hypothetical protein
MENQGQRPIPRQQVYIDGLPSLHRSNQPHDGGHGGQAEEKSQNPFSSRATELGDENL